MICDCVSMIGDTLKEQGYCDAVCKNVKVCLSDGKIDSVLTIPFSYKSKKKDGSFSKKEKETVVHVNFCPFCGKKMIPEATE